MKIYTSKEVAEKKGLKPMEVFKMVYNDGFISLMLYRFTENGIENKLDNVLTSSLGCNSEWEAVDEYPARFYLANLMNGTAGVIRV